MKTGFLFFVADYLLVGQLCTNPKSDSLLSCLKVTQCSTSKIGDVLLYNSCSLYRSKLWQQDHCQHPQNANLDGSTLEGTAQCIGWPFVGGGAETQGWGHRQEDPDQGVHWKDPGNHWWNSPAVWWSPGAIRWPVADPGCGSRTWHQPTSSKRPRLGFRRSAMTLYLSLTGRWTTSFGHTVENITNMTSHNTKASLITAICRVFANFFIPPCTFHNSRPRASLSRDIPLRRWKWDDCYPLVWINSGKPSENDR